MYLVRRHLMTSSVDPYIREYAGVFELARDLACNGIRSKFLCVEYGAGWRIQSIDLEHSLVLCSLSRPE